MTTIGVLLIYKGQSKPTVLEGLNLLIPPLILLSTVRSGNYRTTLTNI